MPRSSKWANVAKNAVKPGNLQVMTHKLYERARYPVTRERVEATEWAESRARDLGQWARSLDSTLWAQTEQFADQVHQAGSAHRQVLAAAGVHMGGGGSVELAYFLSRLLRPDNIVETGVAQGWSTWAFLAAIKENNKGHLWSSDFPYFRLENPEKWIGSLVPDDLRTDAWTLLIQGDRKNLRSILSHDLTIQLAHYDSDKSHAGRQYFVDAIERQLSENSVLVMDDIGDNLWFRDYSKGKAPLVFRTGDSHVGAIGAPLHTASFG